MSDLGRRMVMIGSEVAAILNTVDDDELRDQLRDLLDTALNDELFAGSQRRTEATRHVANIAALVAERRQAAPVVDLFSRRVDGDRFVTDTGRALTLLTAATTAAGGSVLGTERHRPQTGEQ